MRITIVGGGNIGTQFAVHCAEKGHEVTILSSNPGIFEKHLYIVDENENITHEADIYRVTNESSVAYTNADMILVTVPANIIKSFADNIYKYASENCIIGVVPGNGGSECAFHQCIKRGNIFFLMERVPAIARLVKKGQIVKSTGYRKELHIASLPSNRAKKCCDLIQEIFDIPCVEIPCLLNMTLTPSNPLLHTSRLRSIFADYKDGIVYDKVPAFYEEWDDNSSKLLLLCDNELQSICKTLSELNLGYVTSLKDYYEVSTASEMTKKISNIPAFRGIMTPVVAVNKGYIPDLHSRYFTADFSYGLSVIQQIGIFAGVKTPNIDETMNWYKEIAVETDHFDYTDYGIMDKKDFLDFYQR